MNKNETKTIKTEETTKMGTTTRKANILHIFKILELNQNTINYLIEELEITSVGMLVAFTKSELNDLQAESKMLIKIGTIKNILRFKDWVKYYFDSNTKKEKGETYLPIDYVEVFTEESWEDFNMRQLTFDTGYDSTPNLSVNTTPEPISL